MFYMDLIHGLPQSSQGCCRLLILGTVGVCILTHHMACCWLLILGSQETGSY